MATAKILELTSENICKICDNALGKYTCPKCNILYCSLTCYQSQQHLQCSETFYQDCVFENLSATSSNANESKMKMEEILKRMHIDDDEVLDSDDDEFSDLGDRLAGINLDDTEKVWDKLTSDERQEFEAFLRSGDISKLIQQWKPWWLYHSEKKVMDVEEFEVIKKDCPKIKNNIKSFDTISKNPISDVIQYNLINILTAYVFTLRYFNGEYKDHISESIACISKISLNLQTNQNFENFETAVNSVHQQCINISWIYTDNENINLMKEDVQRILKGPHSTEKKFYILCALSDMISLFNAGLKMKNKENVDNFTKTFPESKFPEVELEKKEVIKRHIMKFDFLLSFVRDILCL